MHSKYPLLSPDKLLSPWEWKKNHHPIFPFVIARSLYEMGEGEGKGERRRTDILPWGPPIQQGERRRMESFRDPRSIYSPRGCTGGKEGMLNSLLHTMVGAGPRDRLWANNGRDRGPPLPTHLVLHFGAHTCDPTPPPPPLAVPGSDRLQLGQSVGGGGGGVGGLY